MIEIILIIVGVIFIIVSFFVQEKLTGKDVQTIADMSEKELNVIVEKARIPCGTGIRRSGNVVPG